ncbi:CACTA en-spm transposon protein [Cucumis melo var. makuwa]|uniref:CACTA en-spm transposon protein n=1 Tax=Cucumis melo var. makuwa TaxID=1194695 RepID=A0A5A7UP96_CUCMM|nr:CACTA en-spm transposon protein [Cucumis melo var. makuwa]TYK29087.1 CACTA en-spm transposon protein [Cucumis melo var. makuwa]
MSTSRMTLYVGLMSIPQSLKDWLCVMSLTTSSTIWMNTCHMQAEQATTTHDSDEPRTMSLFPHGFDEMDVIVLEFAEDLDNLAGGSSSAGNNSGTSQPSTTLTPRRRVCVRKTFSIHCLKWVDVGRDYIEVIKVDLQLFFVLDFNDQAINRFVEHQMLSTFKEF